VPNEKKVCNTFQEQYKEKSRFAPGIKKEARKE
jgi:hypothetical protein